MSTVISALLSVAFVIGMTVLFLACCPRSFRGTLIGVVAAVLVFALLNYIGSALVGPADFRPMLVVTPIILATAAAWYRRKVKLVRAQ